LLLWGSLIVVYVIWLALRMPGAALYVHNHTDRPIFSYFVNDNWGGNAAANGGGGMTCCWRIEGETLKVEWIKSMTPLNTNKALGRKPSRSDCPTRRASVKIAICTCISSQATRFGCFRAPI